MMISYNKEQTERFILTYEKYYFKNNNRLNFEELGIPKALNRTSQDLEDYIMKKLCGGCYDIETFAWKSGRADWKNGEPVFFNLPSNCLNTIDKVVNGYGVELKNDNGKPVSVNQFNDLFSINNLKDGDFPECCQHAIDKENRAKCYISLINKVSLNNFGVVHLINALFFLSSGAIPIYDYYVNRAVKSLLMGVSPNEVFIPGPPGKYDKISDNYVEEQYLAINLLEEYIWMLEQIFPTEFLYVDSMCIPRKLDRALWVYGHASKMYEKC